MTTNKLMTGEQLDELMTVAVRMQRDAEVDCNRPSANFAYAVQVAVLELLGTREMAASLSAELKQSQIDAGCYKHGMEASNARVVQVVAENVMLKSVVRECQDYFIAGIRNTIRPTNEGYLHMRCDTATDETPATESFLAEVRAQESKRVYESILDNPAVTDMGSLVDWLEQNANDSIAFAAQLRQEAAQ